MPITNKEIWDMLEKKMTKNSIVSNFALKTDDGHSIYDEDMLIKAVALAYRCGYERAKKGRPFKYGDKVKGNWKPVDPNNLPPIGTKLRLSREIPISGGIFSKCEIGHIYYRTDKVSIYDPYKELWVQKANDGGIFCSSEHPERFDYWMED